MNIKLNVKLSAYTKGVLPVKVSDLPNDAHYISEAPLDGDTYARQNGSWTNIKDIVLEQQIIVEKGSGLDLTKKDKNKEALSIRQYIGTETPEKIADDTTYYIVDRIPDIYINGGTAFSDGDNDIVEESEYIQKIVGGNNPNYIMLPINAKGVYNGK